MRWRLAAAVSFAVVALPRAGAAEAPQLTTGYVHLEPGMGTVVEAPDSRIIFLNRCKGGCTITRGSDDSRINQSSIVRRTAHIAEYPWGNESWDRIVSCVKTLYGQFDIEITDQDPGDTPHFEAIVAGNPEDIGMAPNVGGVAPFSCGVIENAITFNFAEKMGNQPQRICEVIGQETAHAFGLDHELLCQDPMTYMSGCGNKCFRDKAAECGEDFTRECYCGGDTQNSYARISETFGVRQSEPEVELTEPRPGETVQPGFFVRAQGTIPCLVSIEASLEIGDRVEPLGTIYQWPFVFNTPSDAELGPATLRLIATDVDDKTYETEILLTIATTPGVPDAGLGCTTDCIDPGDETGGCATGGAPGALWLVGLALFAMRRRRSH